MLRIGAVIAVSGFSALQASAITGADSVAVADSVPRRLPAAADTLKHEITTLGEIVVTAREASGLTSGSRIDRAAMQHLQPTSFTDLLELLPGNMAKDPSMTTANTITLRETGSVSATGAKGTLGSDYAITSLGTAFVVDGAPVNRDANLQGVGTGSDANTEARSTVNRGVDMRAISTDNIESVEVMRGIPSAEYGNLTSGLVNIRRISRETPLNARFKADEYSKLFAVSKGFGLPGTQHVINADAGYLDSKADPRDNLENYKRVNAGVRANLRFYRPEAVTLWNIGFDFAGTFDNAKTDPDINYNKVDEFRSSEHRYALNTSLSWTPTADGWIKSLNLSAALSYEPSVLERTRLVQPLRASVAPTTMAEGVHDGIYLLSEYIAELRSDSKPLTAFAKLRLQGTRSTGTWGHDYRAGLEWNMAKNLGHGQQYDLTKPMSASWTSRPRDFAEIPALHVMSFFAEDNMTWLLGPDRVELQPGVRLSMLPGLDSRYYLANRVYADPRLNLRYNLRPLGKGEFPLNLWIAAGYGIATKMPTVDYLYPQLVYSDLVQLNYYDALNPAEHSRINLRTYIENPVNYDLRPARNHKYEVRAGVEWAGNELAVTYFFEHMNDGFRYSTDYVPRAYRRYDHTAIDPAALAGPPALESLPYTDLVRLDGMGRVSNSTRIDKEGVEFQLSTARWRPLRTRLIVSGAWLHTRYSNSTGYFQTVNDVVGNVAVSDLYVGWYDDADGRLNDQFNTNFTFDTQITRWGLVFTTSMQFRWWLKTRTLRRSGVPVRYIGTDGVIRDYTDDAVAADPLLKYLVKPVNDALFNELTVPVQMFLNLKATKKIGRWCRISAFVNRIVDYLPSYKSNGITIRRSTDSYFGMELNLTL